MILDRFRRSTASQSGPPPQEPARAALRERDGVTSRLADALVNRLLETGVAESFIDGVVQALMRGPMLEQLSAKVLQDLEASPALDALADRQVERIMAGLQHSEALRLLIREQAGAYLKYLEHHPEQIRRLVQLESRGVLREFSDALRERASSGDDRVEAWARRLLGKA